MIYYDLIFLIMIYCDFVFSIMISLRFCFFDNALFDIGWCLALRFHYLAPVLCLLPSFLPLYEAVYLRQYLRSRERYIIASAM